MVRLEITMSLDGFVAGPNATLEEPLGAGGERLHEWVVGLASWREVHGLEGGLRNVDEELFAATQAATGAVIMGRRMFSGGSGPWEDDPNAGGWWGDDPPFRAPVFILTHHPRDPVQKGETSYTFVTDGIEAAVERARAAAGEGDVLVAGGGSVAQQALQAGLLDELQIHVAPVLLGGGVRLFDDFDGGPIGLEPTNLVSSPAVTHLFYRLR